MSNGQNPQKPRPANQNPQSPSIVFMFGSCIDLSLELDGVSDEVLSARHEA